MVYDEKAKSGAAIVASDGSHGDTRLPFPRGMSAAEFGTGERPGTKSGTERVKTIKQ